MSVRTPEGIIETILIESYRDFPKQHNREFLKTLWQDLQYNFRKNF